jgi:Na+/H+ antiporter NhaD/arsenite permease-like protein
VTSQGDPIAEARLTGPLWRRLSRVLVLAIVLLALAGGVAPTLMPGTLFERDAVRFATVVIFVASYIALAVGRIPGLAIDRAGVALVGASLMVACGALTLDEAYKAVDLDTLTLLLGMMILVANLRLSGFFVIAGGWIIRRAHRPLALLAAVTAIAGLFSAFLVNDAVCLVLAPLVTELTLTLGRNPVPYLLAVAMASNIGSTATITGNPQNMMIGSFSQIPYPQFAAALAPVALLGLVLTVALLALLHRGELRGASLRPRLPRLRVNRVLVARSLAATALVVALFFAGQPPAKAAIVVGALLLLTRRVKSARIYAEIDWSLLLMFTGLFVIVAGAERALLRPETVEAVGRLHLASVPALSLVTAVLSNLVSNVPAVLLLKPFVAALPDHDRAWLVIAMASTLAGNFTVLGSIANLIVVEKAARRGITIGFWDYFRVGAPLTVLTLAVGTAWLMWR